MATRDFGQEDFRDTMPQAEQGSVPPPTLKEQAADLGRKATQGAKQVATQAQSQAQSKLERGKADAAITLNSVATSLLNSGMQLRDEQQAMAGEYVERAARQIERAAHFVQTADLREVVDQVEDFARRRPAVFIGSAFAAGLLAARFLKSSRNEPRRFADNTPDTSYMDREVPAPVADETRRASPATEAWQESPL
ncbi:MAG TPA: hypothetical protein VF128_02505 [Gemmatimonadaceae bacterium]